MSKSPIFTVLDSVNGALRSQEHPELKLTEAEDAADVTPLNFAYPPLHAFRYMTQEQINNVTTRTGTMDVREPLQKMITVAQQVGGSCYCPAGTYLIGSTTGDSYKSNGLHIPYTFVFAYDELMMLKGDGRATLFLAGDDDMVVIRLSDSRNKLSDFSIDANGHSGVTGLGLLGSDIADDALAEHVDWNVISSLDIVDCAEGIELECPAAGGTYFNRFMNCRLYTNTRHIRLRDNAESGGANRNTFFGINMQGGTIGVDIDGADTNAFFHCSFDGVATAFRTNLQGTLHTPVGLLTQDNQLFGCTWELCTTDLDLGNRRITIIGGNAGAVGAITGAAVADLHLGGDAEYRIRALQLGSVSVGLRLQPSAVVYSAQPQLSTSSDQAGAYPFNADGHIILQGRNSDSHDITVRTGASWTERFRISGGGHVSFFNSDVSFDHGADVVITNGSTITTALTQSVSVNPAGAVTGVILEAGTQPGQSLRVMNRGAGSVTFAVVGTSNVADGTSCVIAVNRCAYFTWNSNTSAWYAN